MPNDDELGAKPNSLRYSNKKPVKARVLPDDGEIAKAKTVLHKSTKKFGPDVYIIEISYVGDKFKLVAEDVEKPIIKILSMPIEHGQSLLKKFYSGSAEKLVAGLQIGEKIKIPGLEHYRYSF